MPDTPQRDEPRDDASAEAPRADSGPRLGQRDFAGENVAEDQQRQARERGAGLGAGSSENHDARYAEPGTLISDTRGLERDGNGEPLGGMRPEDDID